MKIPHFETNINDEYHFKEIDTYMKEYWKTHTAVPPHEDDPPYIVARIIEIKENLTMEKNPIKITIENYKDKTIQFTMPHDIPVSILRGHDSGVFNYLNISVVGGDKYIIEEEQLPD